MFSLLKIVGDYDKNEKTIFNMFIIFVIFFNSIILGLEAVFFQSENNEVFATLNKICLYIFVLELVVKLFAWKADFFKSSWNIFDLIIVVICLIPVPTISVFRALRVLRVFRVLSSFNKTRRIITALIRSLPSMFSVIFLLILFFYIYSIICTHLFGASFPKYFGNLENSIFSLFQIMTLESWSESIVRPVMQKYPYAGFIFVSFIFISSYCILNLVVGIIVTSMQEEAVDEEFCSHNKELLWEVRELRRELSMFKESQKKDQNE